MGSKNSSKEGMPKKITCKKNQRTQEIYTKLANSTKTQIQEKMQNQEAQKKIKNQEIVKKKTGWRMPETRKIKENIRIIRKKLRNQLIKRNSEM